MLIPSRLLADDSYVDSFWGFHNPITHFKEAQVADKPAVLLNVSAVEPPRLTSNLVVLT